MNKQSTASNILKSYIPATQRAIKVLGTPGRKIKEVTNSVNAAIVSRAQDLAGFSARPAKDFIRNVQGKPIPEMNASEQRGMNMVGQGISSGLARAALTKWGQNLANRSSSMPMAAVENAKAEAATGWAVPGMKAAFDTAVMHSNADMVRTLLPKIPPKYARDFAVEIGKALKGVPSFPNLGAKSETKKIDFERWANVKKNMIPNKVSKNAA